MHCIFIIIFLVCGDAISMAKKKANVRRYVAVAALLVLHTRGPPNHCKQHHHHPFSEWPKVYQLHLLSHPASLTASP